MKKLFLVWFAVFGSHCMMGQAIQCERTDSGTPALRAESTAELLPDIVLRCKANGAASTVGSYQVIVSANTGLTNRDIAPIASMNWGWNDALLLVNEPSPAAQVGCVPADGQTVCAGQSNANVFQGKRLDDASLVFQGVLIPAPASGKFVILRIVNLRVDATAIASSKDVPAIHTDVKMFGPQGGGVVQVASSERDSAVTRESFRFTARNADGIPVTAPVLITPSSLPMQNPSAKRVARVSFAELFPNAFRRRNSGTSFEDPKFVAAQSIPGAGFQTETGFYNPALPKATRMNEAGLADTGTRLMVRFTGVPANTGLWVSTQDGSQRAALSYGESNGSGAFSPMAPWVPGWAQLYVDNGNAVAIWEVVNADPAELEQLTFSVTLTALNGNPGFGVLKAIGQMGPVDAASLPSFRASKEESGIAIIELANGVELPKISVLSSASFAAVPLAPGALATVVSTFIDPSVNGSTLAMDLIDSVGRKTRLSPLAVASGQASVVLPDKVRTGPAVLNLVADGDVLASESVLIQTVSPSLFSASGDGVGIPVGEVLYLGSGAPPTPLAVFDETSGKWVASPIALTDSANGTVYISVLATGVRNRSQLSAVSAIAGGRTIPAILATAHPDMTGVDIVTVGPLPRELRGIGETSIQIVAEGYESQPLTIVIR